MVQERVQRDHQGRDHQEIVLAAIVAGGAAVAGMAAPQYIHMGGHTGAEFVGIGVQLVGPFVLTGAGLVAFLVY